MNQQYPEQLRNPALWLKRCWWDANMLTPELENENPFTELEREKSATIDIQTTTVLITVVAEKKLQPSTMSW